ncbi:hypothetical protein [Cognatishimia sp. F0-27]|uniref:hypothetical protein n=1 Tax=Cognatishimia sp. F0-27 TaxID=2816855 RepID=UPI001D0C3199|nr:hypothetical protein [Cognatishimia sp. F0-27]MCC1493820.1 hypothetical protein [Cognatishimia sp. F0-27]
MGSALFMGGLGPSMTGEMAMHNPCTFDAQSMRPMDAGLINGTAAFLVQDHETGARDEQAPD